MAQVKLFRVTEFAQSVFPSPLAHRTALHPMWRMLGVAAWVTVLGHMALWRTLWPGLVAGQVQPAFLLALAAQVFAVVMALLALTHWPGLHKWALLLLLGWSALGACVMELNRLAQAGVALPPADLLAWLQQPGAGARLLEWRSLLLLAVTGLLPALLAWRVRVRRLQLGHLLVLNATVLIASCALYISGNKLFFHENGSPLDVLGLLLRQI